MRTIFTKQSLQVDAVLVVFAPTAEAGEPVKFCDPEDTYGLRPIAIGICQGGVPKTIMTPKRHGFMANPHREYKTFIVVDKYALPYRVIFHIIDSVEYSRRENDNHKTSN